MGKNQKNTVKIREMEEIARALGHTAEIRKGHIFRIPEIRNVFHPNQAVAFNIYTLKVLEDGLMPLVVIDIFINGEIATIDLSKLRLSLANKRIFNSLKILPENYFEEIENKVFEKLFLCNSEFD